MLQKLRHIVVAILVIAAIALGYDTWNTNRIVIRETGDQNTHAASSAVNEAPVTSKEKSDYVVAAQMPRMMYVDAIQLQARITRVGITKGGAIDAPKNLDDTSWYEGSVLPGHEGVTFIDGHNQGKTREGVFSKLENLRPGQIITIELGSGQNIQYTVTDVDSKSQKDIDMGSLLRSQKQGINSLILMTCDGRYDHSEQEYTSRVIVRAEYKI